MGRIDWQKAGKKNKPSEDKYEDGTVLKSGRVVSHEKDSLARRALAAERKWLRNLGKEKL